MKLLTLACGSQAKVDDEDFVYLSKWPWRKHPDGYACRGERKGGRKGKYINIRMAVVIAERMGLKTEGYVVDHQDQDPLNNQRTNLRLATKSQNKANSSNTDGSFKGVSWNKKKQLWQAYIKVARKQEHLGYYVCPKQAAVAYNLAAVKHFGEYASLNEV